MLNLEWPLLGAKQLLADGAIFVVLTSLAKGNGAGDCRPRACVSGLGDGFTVTGLNDFNGPAQTTNLGDGRSHHSRRAADLAKVAGLSRMHFAAQFRAATGYRPREYLLHQRIEHAKSLLSNTETPLAEVALTVGFCTQAHFSTVFKRVTGETPARWRCCSKNELPSVQGLPRESTLDRHGSGLVSYRRTDVNSIARNENGKSS